MPATARRLKRWTCSGCGAGRDEWPDSWAWFGSYRLLEEKGLDGIGISCGRVECDEAAVRKVNGRRLRRPDTAWKCRERTKAVREKALAKLTRREREALGLQ